MIDWHEQWAMHGFDFSDGLVHIDFQKLGIRKNRFWQKDLIVLMPGPGFGDFSHPTTRLILKMIPEHIFEKQILDIGSGSGILSLAAIALGAKKAHGIEIDPAALLHAKENCALNGFEQTCTFSLPDDYIATNKPTVLMNMISSEQKIAWQMMRCPPIEQAFTSGILQCERDSYLKQTASWGWKLISEQEEDGWLSFHYNG